MRFVADQDAIEVYRPKKRLQPISFLRSHLNTCTGLTFCKQAVHGLSSSDGVPKLGREGQEMAAREGTYHVVLEVQKLCIAALS